MTKAKEMSTHKISVAGIENAPAMQIIISFLSISNYFEKYLSDIITHHLTNGLNETLPNQIAYSISMHSNFTEESHQ